MEAVLADRLYLLHWNLKRVYFIFLTMIVDVIISNSKLISMYTDDEEWSFHITLAY